MCGAGDVVTAHVVRQGDVFLRAGAYPRRPQFESPDFCCAEMLDDFRAGLAGVAAIENAARGQVARGVGVGAPPLRAFAAGLIQLQHAIGLRRAKIQRNAATGDDRPQPVVHPAPGYRAFILIKTHVQPAAQVIARLRAATSDAVFDAARHGVGRARVIPGGVFEKCPDVAPRGKADAEYVRVFGGVHHLIELGGIKAALEAEVHRQCLQRLRLVKCTAAAEFPVSWGDGGFAGDDTRY